MILSLLREPLLQFLVLGTALFGLFGIIDKKDADAPAKIVISKSRVANLADGFSRTWRRAPSEQELQGLVENYTRDEVFYREGRAAGLDRDDVVIRRRVRQKMEFIAEDLTAAEPSEEQLAAYLASHPEQFKIRDRVTFRHIFLNAERRASAMESDITEVARVLARNTAIDEAKLGDPFLLGEEFSAVLESEVAMSFGASFARQLFALEQGRWQGPISSSFGKHFVFVGERVGGSLPPLAAVRTAVHREWVNSRRFEAVQKLYRSLRERYEIVIESSPTEPAAAGTGQ